MNHPARVWWSFLLVSVIWGTTWITIKDQLHSVPPTWSVAYRFAAAAIAMWAWCAWRRVPLKLPREGHAFAAGVGLLMFCGNFNLVYRAELHVASGLVAVGFALLMVPNAVLGRLFVGRRVSGRFMLGGLVGIAGVGLMFARELGVPTAGSGNVALGLALLAGALLCASGGNVMQATKRAARLDPLAMLAWAMTYGALFNALIALATVGGPVWDPRPTYLLGVLWLGVAASAIAFALYFDLIRAMGPAEAAWTSVVTPVVAMAISTLFEGYRWSALSVAGAVVAFVGLVIALRPARRSGPRDTAAAATTGPR